MKDQRRKKRNEMLEDYSKGDQSDKFELGEVLDSLVEGVGNLFKKKKNGLTLGRSEDSKILGVCAGIADHYNLEVVFVRLGFFLLGITSIGIVVYLVMYFSMNGRSD